MSYKIHVPVAVKSRYKSLWHHTIAPGLFVHCQPGGLKKHQIDPVVVPLGVESIIFKIQISKWMSPAAPCAIAYCTSKSPETLLSNLCHQDGHTMSYIWYASWIDWRLPRSSTPKRASTYVKAFAVKSTFTLSFDRLDSLNAVSIDKLHSVHPCVILKGILCDFSSSHFSEQVIVLNKYCTYNKPIPKISHVKTLQNLCKMRYKKTIRKYEK